MEQKRINLNQSIYSLCNEHPELVELLARIGFEDIAKPGMLHSAGRFMTLPKGAALKKLDLSMIKQVLAENSFLVQE